MSTCKTCGEPTREIRTEGGRRFTLEPDPHPDGVIVPVPRAGDGVIVGRVLTGHDLPAQRPAWRLHRCNRQAGPRCAACRLPMDPDLARLEGWTTHPACDRSAR